MRIVQMFFFAVAVTMVACSGPDPSTNNDGGIDADAGRDATGDDVADVATQSCIEAGCDADLVCDETTGRCVECVDAAECDQPAAPVCSAGACIGCQTNAQCESLEDSGPVCRDDGRCVFCERDSDCPDTEPYCQPDGTCVRCQQNDDCPSVAPACEEGQCHSCTEVDSCDDSDRSREMMGVFCAQSFENEALTEDPTTNAVFESVAAATCAEATDEFLPSLAALTAGVSAGRIAIDEERFAACIAGEEGACSDVWVPQVADGEPCWVDLDCVSQSCNDDTCPGTCEPRSGDGESCASAADCRRGLTCVNTVCIPPPVIGEECSSTCAEGAFCDAGTCAERRGVDGACTSNIECAADLYCDTDGGVCTPLPGPGETCLGGLRCREGVRCWKGTCQPPMPVGEECMASQQCEIGLRCVDGACVEILLPGETCEVSAHCGMGLGCIDGRCRSLPDVGEPCFEEGGCIRGECDLDSGVCSGRAEGDECGGGPYYRDVFDPCGTDTTCAPTGTGTSECTSEGDLGAACGTFLPPCPTPEMTCNGMDVCAVVCAAQAPSDP